MTTESSEELANNPPTEGGWYWVSTNPAWRDSPEVVFVGYPEYDNRPHVYSIGVGETIILLDDYCKRFPRRWLGKLEYPPKW
jgi:hypothetical protein